jgi:hypothetical protein
MRHLLLVVLILLATAFTTLAHPGNGIVVGDDGAIHFADVGRETIWHLDPDGALTPRVRDRWTHCLFLAPDGTLYYEREEPGEGVAPCSFWRIAPDGTHERLIEPQRDRRQFSGGDFVVDASGAVYYPYSVRHAEGGWRTQIMRRTPKGDVRTFTGLGDGPRFTDGGPHIATIRIVTAMAMGPDGHIYFCDRHHVRRIQIEGENAGAVTTIASNLIEEAPSDPPERRGPSTTINRLYGIAVADNGDVIVAYQAGRRVLRVAPDGEVESIHASDGRWSPIGVATRDDDVYVLEVADASIEQLRVVRLSPDGARTTLVSLD